MNTLETIYFLPDEIPLHHLAAVQQKVYGNDNTPCEINWKHLLCGVMIVQDGQPVATLCLYRNPAIAGSDTLLFGNLECINDKAVFNQLMQAVIHYAKANSYPVITGPVNGSTWDEYRLPVSHFGPQFVTDFPQPEYYQQYLLQSGFSIAHRYFTYLSAIEPKTTAPASIQRVEQAGIQVRPIDLGRYEAELEKLYSFCSTAFANNVLYSPITQEDFVAKYRQVKPMLQPQLVWLAEDANSEMQAFILCLPDRYQKDRLVIKTIARNIYNRQSAGLVRYLADIIYNQAYNLGFRHMLHAFMHSSNRSKVLSEKYSGKVFKEYALFTKNVLP